MLPLLPDTSHRLSTSTINHYAMSHINALNWYQNAQWHQPFSSRRPRHLTLDIPTADLLPPRVQSINTEYGENKHDDDHSISTVAPARVRPTPRIMHAMYMT